ncbi:MAG: mechanosensitive ion channel [Holosporales bacterium]|nr:mechanosensitive ion channel [Holosporales bacterium]
MYATILGKISLGKAFFVHSYAQVVEETAPFCLGFLHEASDLSLLFPLAVIFLGFCAAQLWATRILERGLLRKGSCKVDGALATLWGLCRALLPLSVFGLLGFGWVHRTPPGHVWEFSTIMLSIVLEISVMRLVLMAVLSPHKPRARLCQVEDRIVQPLWSLLTNLFWLVGGTVLATRGVTLLLGWPAAEVHKLQYGCWWVIGGYSIIALFRARCPIKDALNGARQEHNTGALMRVFYALNERCWILLSGSILLSLVPREFPFFAPFAWSLAALAGTQIALAILLRIFRALRRALTEGKAQGSMFLERSHKCVTQGESFIIAASYALLACCIGHFFGFSVFSDHTSWGHIFFVGVLENIAFLCLGVVLYQISTLCIDYKLAVLQTQSPAKERRLRTFLPLLSSILHVSIFLLVLGGVVENLGISITPLLAGFGALGLAISFGAQEVMKSFIQGTIVLIEDDMDVGDYVTINAVSGFVERMSIRAVYVREISGALHIIPYSTVGAFSNLSRDYTFQIYELTMDPREEVTRVVQALEEVGRELLTEETYRKQITEPVQVLGISPFDGKGVTILWTVKTVPDPLKLVGFEFYRRLKCKFDAMKINVPVDLHKIYAAEDALFSQARRG